MREAIAAEIIDAYNNTGSVVKKKEEMHKMAQANRAFAHLRW
jgi:small subunit ribosomal protein S7